MKPFFLIILAAMWVSHVFAQKEPYPVTGYTFQQIIKPPFQKKLSVNEIMLSPDDQFLVVNYGNKPTYVVFFSLKTWEKEKEFKLPGWVEFSGAYFDAAREYLYIKTERFSSNYYRLHVSDQKVDTIACQNAPKGCKQSDIAKDIKELYTSGKEYFIGVHRKFSSQLVIYKINEAK